MWRIRYQDYHVDAVHILKGQALAAPIISPRDGYLVVIKEAKVQQRSEERTIPMGNAAIELGLGILLASRNASAELIHKPYQVSYHTLNTGLEIIAGPMDQLAQWDTIVYVVTILIGKKAQAIESESIGPEST